MNKVMIRLTPAIAIRIVADAFMVNVSYLLALLGYYLVIAISAPPSGPEESVSVLLRDWLGTYVSFAWLLTLICFVMFSFSGFYTYGRAYRGRYKALLVFQAVSIAYLLFAFAQLSMRPIHPVPTGVIVASWLLSVFLVAALRVGSAAWRRATWAEAPIWGRPVPRHIRHVTVVGGAGYIGSILVRDLLDSGYHVTVLDSLMYGDDSIRALYSRRHFELVEGDLRNVEAAVRSFRFADAVVHLGGLVGDPACALDEQLTLEINLHATRMLAEVARGHGVRRFLFASSCSVYGASNEILDEKSALNPVSLYARTKIDSENILFDLAGDEFMPTILRFGTVFGISPRPRFDLVVNLLTARAVVDGTITIHGGHQWRPFVHVADVSRALVTCLEVPSTSISGQTFNVGSDDENYTIAQIGELIGRIIPSVTVVFEDQEIDARNYRVSFAKIGKALGFQPNRSVADGIREIQEAIASGAISDYENRTYNNYRWLAEEVSAQAGQQRET